MYMLAFLTHLPVDEHFGGFQVLAIVNNTPGKNTGVGCRSLL